MSKQKQKKESDFQAELIREIRSRFPDSIVLKNDPNYKQGIPDLSIFNGKNWAVLEVKKSRKSKCRPNQEWYINKMNDMSFARFIFPENKEEVLNELEQSFKS